MPGLGVTVKLTTPLVVVPQVGGIMLLLLSAVPRVDSEAPTVMVFFISGAGFASKPTQVGSSAIAKDSFARSSFLSTSSFLPTLSDLSMGCSANCATSIPSAPKSVVG